MSNIDLNLYVDDLIMKGDPLMYFPKRHSGNFECVASLNVYFNNLKNYLIRHISEADVILGCIAWLTDKDILSALSEKNVSIIVQKEDFLRPDIGASSDIWKCALRNRYEKLKCDIPRFCLPSPASSISSGADETIQPIRCAGNYNRDKSLTHPRCHHKFIIFCKREIDADDISLILPYAVWTGSYNFTENSNKSLENALFIRDSDVSKAYVREYASVLAISEPLDWSQDWISPEWRIGT